MVLHNMKHALCIIMVSSSVVSLAMEVTESPPRTNSHESSQEEHEALVARLRSVTLQPENSSLLLIRKQQGSRRGSVPNSSGAGTPDLLKSIVISLHAINENNALASPKPSSRVNSPRLNSPRTNFLYNYGPVTPRSPADDLRTSPPTPITPDTPQLGHSLSVTGHRVIEINLKDEESKDGYTIKRIRIFPQNDFSRHCTTHNPQDYGTIFLKEDRHTKTCVVHRIELNKENNAVQINGDSVKKDLELRASELAAEKEKELQNN